MNQITLFVRNIQRYSLSHHYLLKNHMEFRLVKKLDDGEVSDSQK